MELIKNGLKKLLAMVLFFCTDKELAMLQLELTSNVKRRVSVPLVFWPDQKNYIPMLAIDSDSPDRRYVSLFVDACKPSK